MGVNLAAAAARRRFGKALQSAREAASQTGPKVQQSDVARAMGLKRYDRYSRIERGESWPKDSEWPSICRALRMDDVTKAALSAMRTEGMAIADAWWDGFKDTLPDSLIKFVAYEDAASRVTACAGNILPGLLQTREYAQALVLTVNKTVMSPHAVDRSATMRAGRRQIFDKKPPPHVEAVFSEGALSQAVGGSKVMLAQLDGLIEDAESGRVSFRIIPFAAPATLTYMFTLLEFAGEGDSPIVAVDSMTGMDFKEIPTEVREIKAYVEALRDIAEDAVTSLELIKKKRKEMARD